MNDLKRDALELVADDGDIYEMNTEEHESCWIDVGPVALWIQSHGSSVEVRAFPSGNECEEPLAGFKTSFSDARAAGGKPRDERVEEDGEEEGEEEGE